MTAFFSVLAVALVSRNTILAGRALRWSAFAYSEWLISYAAGFVRRGMAGELIFRFGGVADLLGYVNRIVFILYFLLVFLFAALLFVRKEQNLLRASIALLIPGGIIQMALTNGFYYRKEIIFHVLLITSALLFLSVKHVSNAHRLQQCLTVSAAVLIGALSIVMPFIHEAFIFLTLPAILLIFRAHLARSRVFWYICVSLISIHIVLFGVLAYFKGNPNVASAIWQRVPLADRLMIVPSAPDWPAGGMTSIGWTIWKGLEFPKEVFTSGLSWYWVLAGGAIFLVLRFFFRNEIGTHAIDERQWTFSGQMTIIFGSTVPLYLIGWDWGRWLSAAIISSLAVFYACHDGQTEYKFTLAQRLKGLYGFCLVVLLALMCRIPECCLDASNQSAYQRLGGVLLQLLSFR